MTSPKPNHESDDHTCEVERSKICPKCLLFKFQFKEANEIFIDPGSHEYTFKMELSDDYYKWCVDNAPELRLLPTHPHSDDFQLQTSFIKFKDTNIKIKFSLNR